MPPLSKTLAEFRTAHREGRILAIWGTATIVYALVTNDSGVTHTTEMWTVTP